MGGTADTALYLHLTTATIIDATSLRPKASVVRECPIERSFVRSFVDVPHYFFNDLLVAGNTNHTSSSGLIPISERPEAALASEIHTYMNLERGWDGEDASKPDARSVSGAASFVHLLGPGALALEPSLHVDGTVILESDDGISLRFLDEGTISAVIPRHGGIKIDFDGLNIPALILESLHI